MAASSPAPSEPTRAGDSDGARVPAGPRIPPPPRLPRRRRPPTRRTALSVDAIVEAAIELLDSGGVAGLSMRGVAARLGTGAASLYAHVSGKDELLELIFDELVGRVPLPEPDPRRWREQTHEMMRGLYDQLVSHRDAALAGLGRIPTAPKTLAAAETLTATLRTGGLTDRVIALGLDQLILHVCASAFEAGLMTHSGMTPEEISGYFAQIHAFFGSLPADRYPTLAAVAPDMTGHDDRARLEFAIDALLAGYEALSKADPQYG